MVKMVEKVIFVPTEEQKKMAGIQSVNILNSLTDYTEDVMLQSYILQIVLECFEEQYKLDIRNGYSISDGDNYRPKSKG